MFHHRGEIAHCINNETWREDLSIGELQYLKSTRVILPVKYSTHNNVNCITTIWTVGYESQFIRSKLEICMHHLTRDSFNCSKKQIWSYATGQVYKLDASSKCWTALWHQWIVKNMERKTHNQLFFLGYLSQICKVQKLWIMSITIVIGTTIGT